MSISFNNIRTIIFTCLASVRVISEWLWTQNWFSVVVDDPWINFPQLWRVRDNRPIGSTMPIDVCIGRSQYAIREGYDGSSGGDWPRSPWSHYPVTAATTLFIGPCFIAGPTRTGPVDSPCLPFMREILPGRRSNGRLKVRKPRSRENWFCPNDHRGSHPHVLAATRARHHYMMKSAKHFCRGRGRLENKVRQYSSRKL